MEKKRIPPAIRRLTKELKDMDNVYKKDTDVFLFASPKDSNDFLSWSGTIIGLHPKLKNTPYENGIFKLDIQFPFDYPFKPPKIKFITPIYHCNIMKDGRISLDILRDNWSPALTIIKVLEGVCVLLKYPNPDDPVAFDVAEIYKKDKKEHDLQASLYTKKYAI